MKIKDIVIEGLHDGLTPKEIIAKVREQFPDAKTSPASIAWYKSQLNKEGGTAKKKPAEKTAAPAPTFPPKANVYSIKKVKTFATYDGGALSCDLYRNDKKVAEYLDEGHGGGGDVRWLDEDQPKVRGEFWNWQQEPDERDMTPEEALFYAHIYDLSVCLNGMTLHFNADMYIDRLLNRQNALKQVKRWTKNKTAFIRDGKVYTINDVGSDVIERLRIKHPNAIILNEMSVEEAADRVLELPQD